MRSGGKALSLHRLFEKRFAFRHRQSQSAPDFTGHKLGDYFRPGRADWTGARKIINGNDRAELVARHARTFAEALDTRPH